ncbi:hypothetical protein G7009_01045 [Pseudomonas capeferrum]|nr:hypothetical protein [Pseudomonas capeferrum]
MKQSDPACSQTAGVLAMDREASLPSNDNTQIAVMTRTTIIVFIFNA